MHTSAVQKTYKNVLHEDQRAGFPHISQGSSSNDHTMCSDLQSNKMKNNGEIVVITKMIKLII